MLGRVANGIFWMYRYLERAENTARLLEAGFRMALTRVALRKGSLVVNSSQGGGTKDSFVLSSYDSKFAVDR